MSPIDMLGIGNTASGPLFSIRNLAAVKARKRPSP